MTHVWHAEGRVAPIQSVLVFGAHMDEASRRSVEDGFVRELARHDVSARPAYEIFPTAPTDLEQARKAVDERFHGILVATMKSAREKQTFVPGHYRAGFWSAYQGGWGYGGPGYFYSPGYVETEEEVSFETTLWDTRQEDRLVWTALTRTTNPAAGRDFVRSLTRTVVPALAKAGLTPPARRAED